MINLQEANQIIHAAQEKAIALGQPQNIAVVDGGGHLVAFARMDQAWLGSIDIALKNAWTARAFDVST